MRAEPALNRVGAGSPSFPRAAVYTSVKASLSSFETALSRSRNSCLVACAVPIWLIATVRMAAAQTHKLDRSNDRKETLWQTLHSGQQCLIPKVH